MSLIEGIFLSSESLIYACGVEKTRITFRMLVMMYFRSFLDLNTIVLLFLIVFLLMLNILSHLFIFTMSHIYDIYIYITDLEMSTFQIFIT